MERETDPANSGDLGQRLEQAVPLAQVALLNMVRIMAAEGVPREELALLIPAGWPKTVKRAFVALLPRLKDVAHLLSLGDGIDQWESLPAERKAAYLAAAYGRVMDSPLPDIPHASGTAPV
ncbi:hypothetical protein [Actinocorallia longicatena]